MSTINREIRRLYNYFYIIKNIRGLGVRCTTWAIDTEYRLRDKILSTLEDVIGVQKRLMHVVHQTLRVRDTIFFDSCRTIVRLLYVTSIDREITEKIRSGIRSLSSSKVFSTREEE